MLVSYSSFFGVRLFQFILVILVPLDVEGADVETTDVDSLDVERTDVGSFDVETVDEMGAGVFSPSSIPSMFCNTLFVLWSISRTCDNIFLKASSIFRVIFACSEVISLLVSEIIPNPNPKIEYLDCLSTDLFPNPNPTAERHRIFLSR